MARVFDSGATRDNDRDKLDFEGFISPLVLEAFAQYMHKHRTTPDDFRDSDNWQKGIPLDQYMKSLCRHFVWTWKKHRGYDDADIKEDLLALMFNVQGYLHEILKEELSNE